MNGFEFQPLGHAAQSANPPAHQPGNRKTDMQLRRGLFGGWYYELERPPKPKPEPVTPPDNGRFVRVEYRFLFFFKRLHIGWYDHNIKQWYITGPKYVKNLNERVTDWKELIISTRKGKG